MKEIFIEFIKIFATIMGAVMSLGYFSQAYKIYKNKSSKNISILTFIIFSLGTLTWLVYGIVIKNIPIIVSFILGVIGSWSILILSLIYKKRVKNEAFYLFFKSCNNIWKSLVWRFDESRKN